jgi:hypothetical protein
MSYFPVPGRSTRYRHATGYDHPHGNPLYGLHKQSKYLPHEGKREKARRQRQLSPYRIGHGRVELKANETLELVEMECADQGISIEPYRSSVIGLMVDNQPHPDEPAFHYGDTVCWKSSGIEKCGEVVTFIPAGDLPSKWGDHVKDATSPRDHDSYVVRVGKKLYWPRVSGLRKG